ncbi:SIMPL domain-containing protein [Microbacterium sp. TNHR37B]|uniref:SIMPL domain-containing protein n=1 Tax=Microbacterium sp. TNHR37B TaxID=1775956 RepID=UPI0007B2602D|nr:SIMPL domain-containing protein [Microbacterium sp. TNHR37B]KZE91197.1 hypothetical protein AVP41_00734 [Microbacterium sp. TNHR37B]
MSEVIITVRGEHETRVAPERAVARISAVADGPVRGTVVDRVSALSSPVREDLTTRAEAGSVVEWSSGRVTVWSDRPWNADGVQLDLVHHASVELSATFGDPEALAEWLDTVAQRDGLQVGGVEWQLSPETRARIEREAATRAVATAVERATAYARAIGRSSVVPLEIADLGLLRGAEVDATPRVFAKAAMEMDAAGSPGFAFRPEEIVVRAAVEARFRAE